MFWILLYPYNRFSDNQNLLCFFTYKNVVPLNLVTIYNKQANLIY